MSAPAQPVAPKPAAHAAGTGRLTRVLRRVGQWAPTNPIIGRVIRSSGGKLTYTLMRYGYLAAVTGLLLLAMLFTGLGGSPKDLAQRGAQIFNWLAWLQLVLISLMAPVFAAGAITQEKDNRTFDILLATPLSNAAIVLGGLLSRLLLVVGLLVSGLPVLFIARLYGGVSNQQIFQTFLIAVTTAMVTSAAATLIAVTGVGTRRTIMTFYLAVVGYFVGTGMFSIAVPTGVGGTSWLDPLNPFLAQLSVLNAERTVPPAEVGGGWLHATWVAAPQTMYTWVATALTAVSLLVSIAVVRSVPRRSTRRSKFEALRRRPRAVWANPIAWREANSRAAASRGMARIFYVALGALATAAVLAVHHKPPDAATIEGLKWLLMVVAPVAIAACAVAMAVARRIRVRVLLEIEGDPSPQQIRTARLASAGGAGGAALVAAAVAVGLLPDGSARGALLGFLASVLPTAGILYAAFYLAGRELAMMEHAPARGRALLWPLLRWLGVAAGIVLAAAIAAAVPGAVNSEAGIERTRELITWINVACLGLILVAAINASATAMTAEKEAQTIDLLLLAPMSSNYHVWGKLRGLLASVLPMMAVPVLLLVTVFLYDQFVRMSAAGSVHYGLGSSLSSGQGTYSLPLFASRQALANVPRHTHLLPFEAVLLVPVILVTASALACVLGLAMSLHMKRSIAAFLAAFFVLLGINSLTGFWGMAGLKAYPEGSAVLTPLCPFTSLIATIDPWLGGDRQPSDALTGERIANAVGVAAASVGLALATWAILKAVVRSFDRIVRRQEG